jgi:2,4-dichlorophenol 6-monooxygenase
MAIPVALGLRPGQSEEEGRANLHERFDDTPAGAQKRRQLADALKVQDYNFNALGVELGHRYVSNGITSDGSNFVPTRDPDLFYEATTIPGSPLPHAWVERAGEQVSTLDLTGRGRFTVLTGIGGGAWRDAAAVAAQVFSVPVDVVSIGPGQDVEDPYGDWAQLRGIGEGGCLLIRPDFHVVFRAQDASGDVRRALSEALGRALARQLA